MIEKALLLQLFVLLLEPLHALEAAISVEPSTINAVSTLTLMVVFDETLGKGGKLTIQAPDNSSSTDNAPLSFLDTFECKSDKSNLIVSQCKTPNSNTIEIQLSSTSFVLAGESVVFTLKNACTNPSSTWFAKKSLSLKTYNSANQLVESKSNYLYL